MQKPFYKDFKLGILGGGQLGRMLVQPCVKYNILTHVLDEDANAPCKGVCTSFTQGSFKDYQTVLDFAKNTDLITIEIEHVNVDALEELEKQGKPVYPQSHIIRMVQDKGLQKQFYKENNIPTSEFILLESEAEIELHKDFLPAFQKSRTAGYDGRGVKGIFSENDICDALKGPCLLEKKVDYEKEISIIIARNTQGEIAIYPAVEQVFHPEKNLLQYLQSPADISSKVAEKANEIARHIMESLKMVGLLAVEMFVTKTSEVLVNEIAPRPHNSGHHTIEANLTSQYEQHLRAITGMPLGATDAIQPSVLINLLGEEGYEGEAIYEGVEKCLGLPGVYIHLYGKTFTKPFRKMGHVTVVGKTWEEVKKKAEIVEKSLKIIA
ncbi:MAG: 5-(carboxyamino)imidazole ribonucleotide synthase [Sphingobacteriales bacterium]|nr:MAG: 5-(carboxyamino)imidazole ribonucleotide synthase [Sphingobacteriales bacterium]